ncbi:MAG: hypothetical protein BRC24_00280 [Parcubacteria group bacterium SW_4_46_8]|nr:MAG: hypothetical protein BRC24_00280 [Parcubacteria group bacterium SW_4_46_8]
MNRHSVIFMGAQGSGKGTQASNLREHLKQVNDTKDILHFEAGSTFRSFIKEDGFTQKKVRKSIDAGNMQPVFLPAHFWSQAFIGSLDNDTHLIVDGSPRQLLEAKVMDTAMAFYSRTPTVINLQVRDDVAKERLLDRGRKDDSEEAIKKRLRWHKQEVVPAISFLREQDRYTVADIDANRDIESIFQDILTTLNI